MSGRRRQPAIEAALVILVPEVEDLVLPFRNEYDPSAAKGMPAHITINYPFVPGANPSTEFVPRLRSLCVGIAAFDFRLERVAQFPDLLYLAPEPVLPFHGLMSQVWASFPNSPPYGGDYSDNVPHLTIAQEDDPFVLDHIASEFDLRAEGMLPIASRAREVWLMDNRPGEWRKRIPFPLSPRDG